MFLKKIKLVNYCAYENFEFNFVKPNGKPYSFICFFGPNGIGKSSLLTAIELLTMNTRQETKLRTKTRLAKFVRSKDYLGPYQQVAEMNYENDFAVSPKKIQDNEMLISGTFSDGKKDYVVEINQTGYVRNDLCPIPDHNAPLKIQEQQINSGPFGKHHLAHKQRLIYSVKADSDLSMHSFQIKTNKAKVFEEIVSEITGFTTECLSPSGIITEDLEYCTDYVLVKKNHRIHYKNMSAGEKKIAKSFSILLNLIDDLENPRRQDQGEIALSGYPKIILIDNIVMHVYYKRHVSMVECLKKCFAPRQIFATTHSGTLIQRFLDGKNDQENELWIDLEPINR